MVYVAFLVAFRKQKGGELRMKIITMYMLFLIHP